MLKKIIPAALAALLIIACNNTAENQNNRDTVVINDTTAEPAPEPPPTVPPPAPKPDTTTKDSLPFTGRHKLTLQWLSWDVPGIAFINSTNQGYFTVKGQQQHKDGYLKVDGKLWPISPLELKFEGTITTKVKYLNKGEECVRQVNNRFLSTKGRQYWRLQDMTNCEGSTDYVDIYFQ